MSDPVATADVVELCTILQCLGFVVKSLDSSDTNLSQEGVGGVKTVVINCQSSGIHVVLESPSLSCSCPLTEQHNSGFWEVSGVAGGKQHDKEAGSTLLLSLPKPYRERLSKQLSNMIRCIKALNDLEDASKLINKSSSLVELVNKSASVLELANKSTSLVELGKEDNKSASVLELGTPEKRFSELVNKSASVLELANKSTSLVELGKKYNKSASILELGTPEKRHFALKVETPSRCRSLDTLMAARDDQKPLGAVGKVESVLKRGGRQATYTIRSTPGSVRSCNKTSSPIQVPGNNLLDLLIDAEKDADSLRGKLAAVIKQVAENGLKDDDSMCSMLDVSKISLLKADSKAQFTSSPNLSTLTSVREDQMSKLTRIESASTSNLAKRPTVMSKLRRMSPNIFKSKETSVVKEKDGKKKIPGVITSKIVTPVRTGKLTESSPILNSASKKKYSHIKSTIPRPTAVKKE